MERGSALKLYDEMLQQKLRPNVFTFNAFVDGLCKNGMVERADERFERMQEVGLEANSVVYTSLIDGYFKGGV